MISKSQGKGQNLVADQTVGVIIPDLPSVFLDDYYSKILAGIDDVLKKHEFGFRLLPVKPGQAKINLKKLLKDEDLCGFIIINWYLFPWDQKVFKDVKKMAVLINDFKSELEDVCFVNGNNAIGGYIAAEFLYKKGHRKIAVIRGLKDSVDSRNRFEAFKNYLEKKKVRLNKNWILFGDYSKEKGYEAAKKLLGLKSRPSVIFCENDPMAFGAIEAIKEEGLKVPQDISIMGYDDHSYSSLIPPGLTTIDQKIYDMGKNSAGILISLLRGEKNLPKLQYTIPSLIQRKSVKMLKRATSR